MFLNKADVSRNRLYVTFKGRVEIDEIFTGGKNVIQEAKNLKPGFGVISDIAEFIPTSEEVRLSMQYTMKTLKDMGMGHVVRIVKNTNPISGIQWQRTSKEIGYVADQVETLEEAEILLDQLEKTA